VGCSATFLQLYPALALLKRIHERAPDVVTLIGGPGCETGMGLAVHRHFPWVDYLVSGEADDIVVPLVRRLLREGRECEPAALPAGVRGPRQRLAPPATDPPAEAFVARARDMGGHPTPQYADYFARLAELPRLQSAIGPAPPSRALAAAGGPHAARASSAATTAPARSSVRGRPPTFCAISTCSIVATASGASWRPTT